LFTGSLTPITSLPFDIPENLLADCFKGSFIVTSSLCVIISLVWLREQIINGGGPDWLALDPDDLVVNVLNRIEEDRDDDDLADNVFEEPNNDGMFVEPEQAQPNIVDRAAEELTWERMLGMDGSLVFLEHVFWVCTLNVVFITVFALLPYLLGHFTTLLLGADTELDSTQFGTCITMLVGYIIVSICLVIGHWLAHLLSWAKTRHLLGICYIMVKVALLMVAEVGIFPVLCGWWIDICSLSMFDSTLSERLASLHSAPGTTMFLHWLVGMVFVFYFASFVLLLREVVRPGVLWFLRNLNDPDFHPVQEMITLPMMRHGRRFLMSCVVFGSSILLIVWAPLWFIRHVLPSVLPYSVEMSTESLAGEISLELLLLQVILPQLLEQSQTRQWFKNCVRLWGLTVSNSLCIRSYFLGDVANQGLDSPAGVLIDMPDQPGNIEGLGMGAAQVGHNGQLFVPFQPYYQPKQFSVRILVLLSVTCVSMFTLFVFLLSCPVSIGRFVLHSLMPAGQLHELYTFACGLYVLWLLARLGTLLYKWAPQGISPLLIKIREWVIIALRCVYVGIMVGGVVPLLFGLLYEMIMLLPLRVPLNHTPVLLLWQDWCLGILFTKIVYAATLTGPDWALKRVLEQVFQAGIMQMDIRFITSKLVLPVTLALLHFLCIPYSICGVLPYFGASSNTTHVCHRRIYPSMVLIILLYLAIHFQLKQFKKLYEKVKNDRYLIGKRLVNFDAAGNRAIVPVIHAPT